MNMRWSIRTQVLAISLLPAAIIALLLAVLFGYLRLHDADLFLQERGMAIARQLAQASELAVFSADDETLEREAARALQDSDVVAVRIRGRTGHQGVWMRDRSGGTVRMAALPLASGSLVFSAAVVQRQIALDDFGPESMSGAGIPATRGHAIGDVAVELSRASTVRRQRAQLLGGSLIALACLAGAAALALLLSRRLIRPIRAMAGSVDRLAAGSLDARLAPPGTRELGVLARGINRMADQVQGVQRALEARVEEATRELTAQKLAAEDANAAKGRFLSAASHNVRQPMHALGLFVDALKRRVDDDESRHLLECVEACAGSMGGLLNAVLDLSRIEAGVLRPEVRDFPVLPLVFQVHLAMSAQALGQGLSLRAVPCSAWVRSDPAIVETILMNFVANAIRYTAHGGIVIGCRRRPGTLRIEVWDSGVGIAAEHRQRIFDDFYQVAGVSRGPDRGLGLGLAVVRGLADLLAAPVAVRSQPGRGSVFSLDLPLVAEPDAAPDTLQALAPPEDALQGWTILVVDDDRRILQAMEILLADWGCRTLSAASLEEAVARVERAGCRPDAVLSDFRLPGPEDGCAVIAALRARFGASLPAVLLTGDTEPAVLLAAEKAGLPLLHKPIEPARLRGILSHAGSKRGDATA